MDEVGWSTLFVSLLTAVSLFFSLHHLALRSFSRVRLYEQFKSLGRENLADEFIENVEVTALACLFFRLAANAGIIITLTVMFRDRHYIITFIIALVILEVFTLAIPHSWAKHTGEHILPRTYRIMKLFVWLAWPVLFVFDLHDRFVRRLAGIQDTTPDQEQEEKQEEILSVVEQGRMEGIVDEKELEMIESVLELADTTAEEIMTPRTDVIALDADSSLQKVLDTITGAGHSRIPVYEGTIDNIIGLVYAKDLLTEIGKDPKDFRLSAKIRKAYFVPETKPLRSLLYEFQNQNIHMAVVLDEYGGTAGIVTIEDIIEEVIGEIGDEYEKSAPQPVKKISDGVIEIDARMYIDDLNSSLEVELPEDEDYDTVGGFVFSHLGYIPKAGENFEYAGLRFTVISSEPRKIQRIKIEKLNLSKNPDA